MFDTFFSFFLQFYHCNSDDNSDFLSIFFCGDFSFIVVSLLQAPFLSSRVSVNNLVGLGLLISVIFLSLAELILIYLFVLVSDTASNCILIQNHFHSVQVNIDPFPYYLHTIFHLVIQLTSDQSYQSPMTSFQYGISTNKLQFYHVCTFQFKVWHFNLPCILQSRNSRSQTYSVLW